MTNNAIAYYPTDGLDGGPREILAEGDTITDFRGTQWGFLKVSRIAGEGYSAKVRVSDGLGGTRDFYTSVFPGLIITVTPPCCDGTGDMGLGPDTRCLAHTEEQN